MTIMIKTYEDYLSSSSAASSSAASYKITYDILIILTDYDDDPLD